MVNHLLLIHLYYIFIIKSLVVRSVVWWSCCSAYDSILSRVGSKATDKKRYVSSAYHLESGSFPSSRDVGWSRTPN